MKCAVPRIFRRFDGYRAGKTTGPRDLASAFERAACFSGNFYDYDQVLTLRTLDRGGATAICRAAADIRCCE